MTLGWMSPDEWMRSARYIFHYCSWWPNRPWHWSGMRVMDGSHWLPGKLIDAAARWRSREEVTVFSSVELRW